MEARQKKMRALATEAWEGILLPVQDITKMPPDLKKEYLIAARDLLMGGVIASEVNRLKNAAGQNILRHTKTDEEVAWNRGVLHGLESLMKRLEFITTLK